MGDPSLLRVEPDPRTAIGKFAHFCRSTGIGGYVMDDEGLVLAVMDGEGNAAETFVAADAACPVCRILGPEETENELRSQLYGAWQAERIGGKYIHLCAHSLLYIVAPVFEGGALWVAFVCGPVMIVDPAEILVDLRSGGIFPQGREAELTAAFEAMPRVSPRRATSIAELLADLAAATGGALSEPVEAAREREELESRISERIHDLKDDSEASPPYPIEREHELLNAISRGDKADSQRLLNDILGHIFFASGRNPAIIRARVLELVVLISRAALDGGADVERIFDLGFTYLNQIQKMRSVDDIALWLSRVMNRFSDLVFNLTDVKHADVMMKAMRYINARFDKPITLDEVAEAVSLSPTYFSKIWNEEMKCRFTAYLNKLRIERARVLLLTTDTPLVEIAGLMGYEDQSYFNKVFKKMVGQSPGRFRESAGRSPRIEEIHE